MHVACTTVKGHKHATYHHQSWACAHPYFMLTTAVLWVCIYTYVAVACALPSASSRASAAGWMACWCFRGLGAGGGHGGFAVPDFGRANAFPSAGVASEARGNFSKRWPSAETGGGLRPLGRAKSKAPFGFQGEFCYSQTI